MTADGMTPATSLDLLGAEASRQLTICNACRYCEGLCAVFPALERRPVLDLGAVSQLANLCHDCRACYGACMYDPPHEFAIDLPKTLSAVRVADYGRHVWPARVPRPLRGRAGLVTGAALSAAVVVAVAVANTGGGGLVSRAASPYQVVPYGALLALILAACAYSVAVCVLAVRSYWREADSGARVSLRAIGEATWHAATLRYLRGGGAECYYPADDRPSRSRRLLHGAVA